MKRIYDKCCGIDVHKKLIVACLVLGKKQEVCEFGTTTRELLALADWLLLAGCQMVAMESTGSAPIGNLYIMSWNPPALPQWWSMPSI